MNVSLDKPMTLTQIWGVAFRSYTKLARQEWRIITAIVGLQIVSTALPYFFPPFKSLLGAVFALVIALPLVYLLAMLLYKISTIFQKQKFSAQDSFLYVYKRICKIYVTSLLAAAISFLGMLLLVLPGVFFFISFMMLMPVLLFEEEGYFAAIKKTVKLVWGKWWQTFGTVFLPLIFLFLIVFVLTAASMAAFFGFDTISPKTSLAFKLLGTLIGGVFFVLHQLLIYVQYKNLKARKILEKTTA